jgi:cytoskeletal protein RodZ
MAFENMDDIDPGVEEAGPPPEESSNKPFLIVAGILGGIMLLSLLCLAAYAFLRFPTIQAQRSTQAAEAVMLSTDAAISVRQTADAKKVTATYTPTTTSTATPEPPTATMVVAMAATKTATPAGPDPRTATVSALLTQAAAVETTAPVITATVLPQSGFADEVGMPGMLALAGLMVGLIFVARRMRTAH